MPIIFWKKAKKSVGAMSKEERTQFAKELASEALSTLTRPVIPNEIIASLDVLESIEIQELFKLHSVWSVIYKAERKNLIEKSYSVALETLKRKRKLKLEELIYWKQEYYFYDWLDGVIAKPLMSVYDAILYRRSILQRQGYWSDALEKKYRDISFGKREDSGPILLTLDLLIREKSKIYEYEVKIDANHRNAATETALSVYLKHLSQGVVSSASDFRTILSF